MFNVLNGELEKQFTVPEETVRLHLHLFGKTYRLRKWVPHTMLEIQAACMSFLIRRRTASIFNRVLTSEKKVMSCMTLSSIQTLVVIEEYFPSLRNTTYAPT
ncbi:hypothetical protein NPIL_102971 [Nephila pilipes]|uniref:Uncharacterized protein n=1 Tax=Nephila pilipes TaxID=299642 RepID=A0A8X6QPZ5_NEPPI|nr:hypothetical protein NPIL_102971 [Nephila pilipes]